MWNPLLETNVYVRTWYDIAEEIQHRIEWAARKGKHHDAYKNLNILDLIDSEASAYWREYGMALAAGVSPGNKPAKVRVFDGFRPDERIQLPAVRRRDADEISLI